MSILKGYWLLYFLSGIQWLFRALRDIRLTQSARKKAAERMLFRVLLPFVYAL
jgi:hypothetical protein